MRKNQIPNCLTCLRILGAVSVLFLTPLTLPFYVVYALCGVTDVLDGAIARATKSQSHLGAMLDSAADLLFYIISFARMAPLYWREVARPIWYVAFVVGGVRLLSYAVAALRFHCFASMHTYGNKLTGAAFFAMPLLFRVLGPNVICGIVCAIGLLASLEELCIHLSSPSYDAERKSLFAPPAQKPQNT